MVENLNRLGYDGWVIGNHEFDWGPEPLFGAIDHSKMPVLSSNLEIGGKAAGEFSEKNHAFSKVKPYHIYEVAGFKIGVVGLTTPGLLYWLPESLRGGIEPIDAEEKAKEMVAEVKAAGAHVVIVAGHMGFKSGNRDDYANPVRAIMKDLDDVDVFIGGHTHQDFPSVVYEDTLFTQAGYHGIYAGRVDLCLSRSEKKLLDRRALSVLMDNRFDADPIVMDIAKDDLDDSAKALKKPVGHLVDSLPYKPEPAGPTGVQELVGAAVMDSLAQDGIEVDGVFHGAFVDHDVEAGKLSMDDMWHLVPYENMLLVARLNYSELVTVLEEAFGSYYNNRRLVGFEVDAKSSRYHDWQVSSIRKADGTALDPIKRYTIAFNAYGTQSGGKRMERLRSIVRLKNSRQEFHAKLTRDDLAEFFLRHNKVDLALIEQITGKTPDDEKAA